MKITEKDKAHLQALARSWRFGFKYPPLIIGIAFLLIGPLLFFADSNDILISGQFSQQETGVFFFSIGVFLLVIWYIVYRVLAKKLRDYKPRENQGDEWMK